MNVPFLSLHDVTAMHGDEIREAASTSRTKAIVMDCVNAFK